MGKAHGWSGKEFVSEPDRPKLLASILLAKKGKSYMHPELVPPGVPQLGCCFSPIWARSGQSICKSAHTMDLDVHVVPSTRCPSDDGESNVTCQVKFNDFVVNDLYEGCKIWPRDLGNPDGDWLTNIRSFPNEVLPLLQRCLDPGSYDDAGPDTGMLVLLNVEPHADDDEKIEDMHQQFLAQAMHQSVLCFVSQTDVFLFLMSPRWSNLQYPPLVELSEITPLMINGWHGVRCNPQDHGQQDPDLPRATQSINIPNPDSEPRADNSELVQLPDLRAPSLLHGVRRTGRLALVEDTNSRPAYDCKPRADDCWQM